MANDKPRAEESSRSACIANDKTDGKNKSVASIKRSLAGSNARKTAGDAKSSDRKKTLATEKTSITANGTDPRRKPLITRRDNDGKSDDQTSRSVVKKSEGTRDEKPGKLKIAQTEAAEDQEVKQIALHETEIKTTRNNETPLNATSPDKIEDNSRSRTTLPSKIPVLMSRKIGQSTTQLAPLGGPKKSLNSTPLSKSVSTKLPIASQVTSKLTLKIQSKVSRPPVARRVGAEDNSTGKSGNARPIEETTENARNRRISGENRPEKEGSGGQHETVEGAKVPSADGESKLNENSRAAESTRDDPSANLSEQTGLVEDAIEGSSDTLSSDSECSEESEDTGTALYVSDRNSEYSSVEEFTDAELLLEKTLNEIRSEISEEEEEDEEEDEEQRSESEGSEDITYSYETESHDPSRDSSAGSVDKPGQIDSSLLEDSAEEDLYEELPSEGEEVGEQFDVSSQQLDTKEKTVDDKQPHDEAVNTEILLTSHEMEDTVEVTVTEGEADKPESSAEATVSLAESTEATKSTEINEKTSPAVVPEDLKVPNSNIPTTEPTSSAKPERPEKDIRTLETNSKENQTKVEGKIEQEVLKRVSATARNNAAKQPRVTSAKRAKIIGRRASTGSKGLINERDDSPKGVDRAGAPRKRFSLVASCIRRFEGEESAETARDVDKSNNKVVQRETRHDDTRGSPKTEREVSSRRELPRR